MSRRTIILMFSLLIFLVILLLILLTPWDKPQDQDNDVRVVSWGGQFQADLMDAWVAPAAERAKLKIQTEAWDGDYSSLTSRIEKGLNHWDLVHVESIYVMNPKYASLFESFPDKQLDILNNSFIKDQKVSPLLTQGYAVPVLEYAIIMAGSQRNIETLTWTDFFDTKRFPGRRGMRDFPVGNIEAAISSLGHDPKTYLYSETDENRVREKLDEAFARLTELAPNIIWWKTGDMLQQSLESGDVVFSAAWSGRVLAAFRTLCPSVTQPSECKSLGVNPETALVSTDWWIIPRGAIHKSNANQLLIALFSGESRQGATDFSSKQGYAAPISDLKLTDSITQHFLNLGTSSNIKALARLDEDFWGRHYEEIYRRWLDWRAKYGE